MCDTGKGLGARRFEAAAILFFVCFCVLRYGCGQQARAGHSGLVSSTASGSVLLAQDTAKRVSYQRDSDGDVDDPAHTHYDADDSAVLYFGHAAGDTDRRAVTGLIKRYYAAAAADNGVSVCSLVYALQAELAAESYGEQLGLPNSDCAVVMSKLMQRRHAQAVAEAAALEVLRVRIEGNRGVVVLRVGKPPVRHVFVRKDHGVWRMNVFFDIPLP
jgi:hypothetical protein